MEAKSNHQSYPANWGVQFLCDCIKKGEAISLHSGVTQKISTHGIHLFSDHLCKNKRIAMHLMIPSQQSNAPLKIVKIIGHNVETELENDKFLTEIEFVHFEEDGLKVLEKSLHKCFDPHDYPQIAECA